MGLFDGIKELLEMAKPVGEPAEATPAPPAVELGAPPALRPYPGFTGLDNLLPPPPGAVLH